MNHLNLMFPKNLLCLKIQQYHLNLKYQMNHLIHLFLKNLKFLMNLKYQMNHLFHLNLRYLMSLDLMYLTIRLFLMNLKCQMILTNH
jgi:hypothetical protein